MDDQKKIAEIAEKAERQGWLNGFDFSVLIQRLAISEHGYVIDTGIWENVNAALGLILLGRIKRHPIIWKLFFQV